MEKVLNRPYSIKEIINLVTEENPYIEGNILVSINELIENDYESVLNLLAIRLVDNDCLMDITYKVVGLNEDKLLILNVRGDISDVIEFDDEMIEELKKALFMNGIEVLEDFTNMDLSNYDDKDVLDNLLDEIISQMPNEEILIFYKKYVN